MKAKLTSAEIEAAVRNSINGVEFWISQCRVGCGWGDDGARTVDLWGISTRRPYHRLAVEIKVSRSDYTRDLRQPLKQRRARLMSNQFYYAAPAGLLTAADMPTWAGLIEVHTNGEATMSVQAPWFDSAPPTWSFVASLIRRFTTKGIDEMPDNT